MLINLSNHPYISSDNGQILWPEEQTRAATTAYGKIFDLPFPAIPPDADRAHIVSLAQEYAGKILYEFNQPERKKEKQDAVHIMGELTFTFTLVSELQRRNILCVASTTKRNAEKLPDGKKQSEFVFVQFREYPKVL